MSNNGDDFQSDQVDFNDVPEDGLEGFEAGGGTTLGDMWRNNPLVKIGIIAGGLIAVIGVVVLFGGSKDPLLLSKVKGGQSVNQPPGEAISESYRAAVEEENLTRTEEAIRKQESAMPTPVDTSASRLNLPTEEKDVEDPLKRWRRIQEERQRQVAQQKPEVVVANPYAEAIDALAKAMAAQMQSILQSKKMLKPEHVTVTDADFFEKQAAEKAEQDSDKDDDDKAEEEVVVNILIPAGKIEYGQLIVEANSDTPGPILAQLVSGPLAGSRLLGSFETQDENLILSFNTIVVDGIAHPTEAVAMNPETTSLGMVTDIDHRYFTRVILPAAAAFVDGMGKAIADTGSTQVVASSSTTTTTPEPDARQELFKGVEEASGKVSEILDENAQKTEPMIRVESGTPMGLLFVEPVTDEVR